jgi:hypothetical protein
VREAERAAGEEMPNEIDNEMPNEMDDEIDNKIDDEMDNEIDDKMEREQATEAAPEQSTASPSPEKLSRLQKACLEFCIALLDHRITRQEYDSLLVCALAVLGVKEEG